MMMTHKYIIFPSFNTVYENREEALDTTLLLLNSNADAYEDGESIRVRYLNENAEVTDALCIINKTDGIISITVSVTDKDGLRIVESDVEPDDKDVLWLSDTDDEEDFADSRDLEDEIVSLKRELKVMKQLLCKHDYALTNSLSGGDFITNSVKYRLENSALSEMPDNAEDDVNYANDDFEVDDISIMIGNTSFDTFVGTTKFVTDKEYYFKVRFLNKDGEIIRNPEYTIDDLVVTTNSQSLIATNRCFKSVESGDCAITFSVGDIDKVYELTFEDNLRPDYNLYGEPTLPHVLVKNAQSKDILFNNSDYLLPNEFVWCKQTNTLYFYAEASNGNVVLFPVNGGNSSGEIPETGVTSSTVSVEGQIVKIKGTMASVTNNTIKLNGDNVYVDEYGILHISNSDSSNTGNSN